jgi:hypothetical protein
MPVLCNQRSARLVNRSGWPGIYTPSATTIPGDPRSATFQLKSGVAIYGGFAGNETTLSQRDWNVHPTILSGDIDNNDKTNPQGVVTNTTGIVVHNSYHVVKGS